MCGFAGIVHFDPRQPVDVDRLRRMRDVLSHRGPDGVGSVHRRSRRSRASASRHRRRQRGRRAADDQRGRQRLDRLQRRDLQPRLTAPGLEAKGHRYRSRCDTETIIHLYEEEGDASSSSCTACSPSPSGTRSSRSCCSRAIGSASSRSTTPCTDSELVFGSEIKSFFAAGCASTPTFNEEALARVSLDAFRVGRAKRSSRASASFCLVMCSPGRWTKGLRTRRYWQLPAPSDEGSDMSFEVQAKDLRGASKRRSKAI